LRYRLSHALKTSFKWPIGDRLSLHPLDGIRGSGALLAVGLKWLFLALMFEIALGRFVLGYFLGKDSVGFQDP
jgi:hypothetical protein